MIWFTSDAHYGHNNIIRLCNRPFNDLNSMHEFMIQEWNKRVKNSEQVYILGDFSFAGIKETTKIISQLKGYKILILGNHDRQAKKMLSMGFDEVHENIWIEIGTQRLFLSHFPYHPMSAYYKLTNDQVTIAYPQEQIDTRYLHKRMVDDGQSWLLHGHVHNAYRQNGRQINVGVDQWGFKPVPHEKILQMIKDGPKVGGNTGDQSQNGAD